VAPEPEFGPSSQEVGNTDLPDAKNTDTDDDDNDDDSDDEEMDLQHMASSIDSNPHMRSARIVSAEQRQLDLRQRRQEYCKAKDRAREARKRASNVASAKSSTGSNKVVIASHPVGSTPSKYMQKLRNESNSDQGKALDATLGSTGGRAARLELDSSEKIQEPSRELRHSSNRKEQRTRGSSRSPKSSTPKVSQPESEAREAASKWGGTRTAMRAKQRAKHLAEKSQQDKE